jgi:cobyrinic acid a,c-diamide synthase
MNIPRVMIAGTHSGAGKTSVSLAVTRALKQNGYRVRAYKVGPDYIDPSYHAAATERPSHNLDDWMMGGEAVKWLFKETAQDCDIAVIEGVMGLFDGFNTTDDAGSTARIAKLLRCPVILVVDTSGMARSVAAVVKGYQTLDEEIKIAGVILNRVASQNHLAVLKEAVEFYNRIPVLGAVFRNAKIHIPERHLGLKTASENTELLHMMDELSRLTQITRENTLGINLESILETARQYSGDNIPVHFNLERPVTDLRPARIAYAQDKAFQFYYQANLDYLRSLGAELIPFNPTEDGRLPENIHGLYFGGGFPEIYARQLEDNRIMREAVREAVAGGTPTYAECGGLMYLTEGIKTLEGKIYKMAGVIPGLVEMTPKLVNFGYCESELLKGSFLGKAGERFRGHEFHYSRWDIDEGAAVHRVDPRKNRPARLEGYQRGDLLASYIHCHFLSYPQRALRLVEAARNFSKVTTNRETV